METTDAKLKRLAAVRSRLFDVVPDPVLFKLLAYQHRLFEPELKYVPQLVPPGTVAVDVGAWWGPWTYWLARAARQVITCEPIPHLAAFLESVRPANVKIVPVALSDHVGEEPFWLPAGGRGTEGVASLEHPQSTDGRQEILVPVMPLDDLELTDIGLLKIDVEGHELAVLKGAVETVTRCRPTLVIEVEAHDNDRNHVNDVFTWITSLGYTGRFLLRGAWHPVTEFDLYNHQLRWEQDILRHGYVRNLVGHVRQYVNNFVFTPTHPAPRSTSLKKPPS